MRGALVAALLCGAAIAAPMPADKSYEKVIFSELLSNNVDMVVPETELVEEPLSAKWEFQDRPDEELYEGIEQSIGKAIAEAAKKRARPMDMVQETDGQGVAMGSAPHHAPLPDDGPPGSPCYQRWEQRVASGESKEDVPQPEDQCVGEQGQLYMGRRRRRVGTGFAPVPPPQGSVPPVPAMQSAVHKLLDDDGHDESDGEDADAHTTVASAVYTAAGVAQNVTVDSSGHFPEGVTGQIIGAPHEAIIEAATHPDGVLTEDQHTSKTTEDFDSLTTSRNAAQAVTPEEASSKTGAAQTEDIGAPPALAGAFADIHSASDADLKAMKDKVKLMLKQLNPNGVPGH